MEKVESIKDKFVDTWSIFLSICFDPLVIVSIISLAYLYNSTASGKPTPALIYILITAISTIFGIRITQKWSDITEGGIVKARGRTAVRSLKLLLGNISSLEQRVIKFSGNPEHIKDNPGVTTRNYEEIREKCLRLQEEVISSIENWTEFVPEADIKTQIGEITGVATSLQQTEEELANLKTELNETKDNNKEEKKKLNNEIKSKILEIKKISTELRSKSLNLGLDTYNPNPFGFGLDDSDYRAGFLSRGRKPTILTDDQFEEIGGTRIPKSQASDKSKDS